MGIYIFEEGENNQIIIKNYQKDKLTIPLCFRWSYMVILQHLVGLFSDFLLYKLLLL